MGATLGKKLLRLRVVGNGGQKPALRDALLRNILKIFELSTLAGPMWWFFICLAALPAITRYRQRLGDMMGRTAVIEAGRIRLPAGTVAEMKKGEMPSIQLPPPNEDAPLPIPPELRKPEDKDANEDGGTQADDNTHPN